MRLNAKQIGEYVGGLLLVEPIDSTRLSCGVTWDSREVQKDDLYIALEGETHDGYEFIDNALRSGALVVLTTRAPSEATCLLAREMGASIIEVSNTYTAITDLARAWRGFLRGRIIGVTGSTGKTTTKDLIKQVLSASFSVVATRDNQNNELGVPRTILSANPETDFIVVEMGMRGSGQITELCDFVRPDIGVITNIGESHIELLGSCEAIAQAKAELLMCLPPSTGIAVLNANDSFYPAIIDIAQLPENNIETIAYASEPSAERKEHVFATELELDGEGKPHFTINYKGERALCSLHLRGRHNVSNALAAAAVGICMNMSIEEVSRALALAEPVPGRQRMSKTRDGVLVLDDAYNASPDSMRAALLTLDALDISGRRVAVLGDMGELGDYSKACHVGMGHYAASRNLDYLLCVGGLSRDIATAAEEAGMASDAIVQVDSTAEALAELEAYVEPGDAVLVKASHAMRLDRVVKGLMG